MLHRTGDKAVAVLAPFCLPGRLRAVLGGLGQLRSMAQRHISAWRPHPPLTPSSASQRDGALAPWG